VIPYALIAVMRYGAAWTFVAHSSGKGAPEQEPDVGAMIRSIEAADVPACREETFEKDGEGMTKAQAILPRRNVCRSLKIMM
jgi:hypothetical protein